jgi:hypothetical protein
VLPRSDGAGKFREDRRRPTPQRRYGQVAGVAEMQWWCWDASFTGADGLARRRSVKDEPVRGPEPRTEPSLYDGGWPGESHPRAPIK